MDYVPRAVLSRALRRLTRDSLRSRLHAMRALAEVLVGSWPSPWLTAGIVAGGLGQLLAALLFVVNMWWRVRMPPAAAPGR